MYRYLPIRRIYAREVLDSRGNPTVEVEVTVGEGIMGVDGYTGRALVPSGASTGQHEALELRDGGSRFCGLGVQKAVDHVNGRIAEAVLGENALNQAYIDQLLQHVDGTEKKCNLGANATLGVSLAVACAAAKALRIPLYQYLGGVHTRQLPVPMLNILNGGKHADNTVDLQEFMIMPIKASSFYDAIASSAEVYHILKQLLKERKLSTSVGDEGGFAANLKSSREVLQLLSEAIWKAGYEPGKDFVFAIDAAASELYDYEREGYVFLGEDSPKNQEVIRTTEELLDFYQGLVKEFPIYSIEDPFDEEDWDGWNKITERLGDTIQIVGDDLFVTNAKRLALGIEKKAANAILIKVNQIGTLSEAIDAVRVAQKAGYRVIISHRSGETEDPFIADLAVALGASQIKAGAPCRTDRTAKYNQLLRIEDYMGSVASYQKLFTKMNEIK